MSARITVEEAIALTKQLPQAQQDELLKIAKARLRLLELSSETRLGICDMVERLHNQKKAARARRFSQLHDAWREAAGLPPFKRTQ